MATSPFLPSFIDHPNDLRSEEIVNYNQHKELGAATLSASSLGNDDDPNRPIYNIQCSTMFVGNANGLKTNIQAPVSITGNANALKLPNNIQGSIPIACNTNGLNMPINNNQASMHYPFETNSQSQDNNCKILDIYTNSKTGLAAPFREQDQYMPIANVVRIMRRALPPQAKVADEAKELLQGCVSEFISFITSEANEHCHLEHRKTITAEDVIRAMSRLGFDHYVQPISMYLQKYRESEMLPTAIPRSMAYLNNDVNAITTTTSVMPPFALVHSHYAMITTLPSVSVGNGPNLALRIGDGSGGSDGAGSSKSPQNGFDFFYTYDKYK